MEAYKFETTVLENGIIQIPEIADFVDSSVEIFMVIKPQGKHSDVKKTHNVDQFLKKWTGFLKEENTDEAKLQYLQEKYS